MLKKYQKYAWAFVTDFLERYPRYAFLRDEIHAVVFYITANLIKSYSRKKGKFYAYWHVAAEKEATRYIYNYLSRYSHGFIHISLDGYDSSDRPLHDVVGREDSDINKDMLYESLLKVANDPYVQLSRREKLVIKYYLDGYSFKEIADKLYFSPSVIYKAFHSAVNKIGKVLVEKNK